MRERELLEEISKVHSYAAGFNGRLSKYRALTIREIWQGGGSLLDLGVGEGMLTRLISDGCRRIECVEASPHYMAKARDLLKGHPVTFHSSLIEDFDTDSPYDLVVASGVLEHVREPQEILEKVRKWIGAQGRFIAIVPNATALHRRAGLEMGLMKDCYELGEQDFRVGHRRYYDMQSLREEAERAGLTVIQTGGILLKPLPNSKMEELSEEYCDALYEIGREYPELCAEIFVVCK
ncbi:MAG: class I SAM-dependent methyltransferase [Nitrospirales bacterium]|nr:class I SAM-dependent methyltransferase [Nitrospirales bacterium]